MKTIRTKARFVGGKLHNRVIDCTRRTYTSPARPIHPIFPSVENDVASISYEAVEYKLLSFVSEGGARYSQFVHKTLIDGDRLTIEGHHLCRALHDFPEFPDATARKMKKKLIDLLSARYAKH